VEDPKNVKEDSRKRTGTTTFELGSGANRAADRTKWRTLVYALHVSEHEED